MSPRPGQVAIYYLVDPRAPDVVRYVGQTATPFQRHLMHCRVESASPRSSWVAGLRAEGIMPQMIVAEWVPEAEGNAAELRHTRANASPLLTNVKDTPRRTDSADQKRQRDGGLLRQARMSVARDMLRSALANNRWKIAPVARQLGMSRPAIYDMMKAYGVSKPVSN